MNPLQEILMIIQTALNALTTIPSVSADAALANAFLRIIQSAMGAYQKAAGSPLDLSKIPLETKVP